jgi:multidrug efflux system membrane fusion protein
MTLNENGAPEPVRAGWLRPLIYVVLLVLIAAGVWRVYQNRRMAAQQMAKQADALLNRPVPVQVTTVDQKPMPIYLTALGTVTPYYSVTVKARVSGQLDRVNFIEGQTVRQNDTILVVDPLPYKAALDQAKGTLAHDVALLQDAQAEYRRYKALYEAGVVSKEQLDLELATQGQYEGAIQSDKAAIETAQLQLNWCTVQSPITGKIGLRLVDPGNIITANTTNLVIINQMQPIAVYFTLPENQLPQVLTLLREHRPLVAEAFDRSDTTRLAAGQLLTADNQIDTTTGTDRLKAVFANTDEQLFPNQFVNIHLILEERPSALVVPSSAIQTGNHGAYVWTIHHDAATNADLAQITPVKVALAEGQVTILDGGVAKGDTVVIDGADRLRAGSPVTVNTSRGATPGVSAEGNPELSPVAQGLEHSAQTTRGRVGKGRGEGGKRTHP